MFWCTRANRICSAASDAAAFAGATYLSDTTFSDANAACTYATPAQQAACRYALANGVLARGIQSITVAADGKSVTVVTSRKIPATFARLLGFTQFTIKAQAVGGITGNGQTYKMIPVGIDGTTPYTYCQAIVNARRQLPAGLLGRRGLRGQSGHQEKTSELHLPRDAAVT